MMKKLDGMLPHVYAVIVLSILLTTTIGCGPTVKPTTDVTPKPNPAEPGTLQLAVKTKDVSYSGVGQYDTPYDNIYVEGQPWSNWYKSYPVAFLVYGQGQLIGGDLMNMTYISSDSSVPLALKYTDVNYYKGRVRWPTEFRSQADPIDFSVCVKNEKLGINCDGGIAGVASNVMAINQKKIRIEDGVDIYGVYFWRLLTNSGSQGATRIDEDWFPNLVDDNEEHYERPWTYSPDVLWGFRYCENLNTERDFPAWRNMIVGSIDLKLPQNLEICARRIQHRKYNSTVYCGNTTDGAYSFQLYQLRDYLKDHFELDLYPGKMFGNYIHVLYTDRLTYVMTSDSGYGEYDGLLVNSLATSGLPPIIILEDNDIYLKNAQMLLAHELGHAGGLNHRTSTYCERASEKERYIMCESGDGVIAHADDWVLAS